MGAPGLDLGALWPWLQFFRMFSLMFDLFLAISLIFVLRFMGMSPQLWKVVPSISAAIVFCAAKHWYVVHKGSHITVGYRTVPSGTVRHPRVPLSALLSLLYSALLYIKKKGTSSSFANLPICFADVAIAFAKSFPFNSVHQTARNCANLSICFADVARAFTKAIPYNSVHQTASNK